MSFDTELLLVRVLILGGRCWQVLLGEGEGMCWKSLRPRRRRKGCQLRERVASNEGIELGRTDLEEGEASDKCITMFVEVVERCIILVVRRLSLLRPRFHAAIRAHCHSLSVISPSLI